MDEYFGAHLYIDKGVYTHHGLGVGNGKVIHYAGLSNGLEAGPICEVSLSTFAGSCQIQVKKHPNRRYSCEAAVERARSRLGEDAYSIWGNNCEHFMMWCIDGIHTSDQVDGAVKVATAGSSVATGLGAVEVVSSCCAVAGLSGPGVMSGLASTGALVGGGAVAGAGLLAGIGGLGMATLLNNTVLADNEALPGAERNARQVGRLGTTTGAVAGSIGGIGAISAAGTTAGLSAAGITSGLSAIGATVGGGMVAGTAIVVAAPVVVSAIVGLGLYKFFQWLTS